MPKITINIPDGDFCDGCLISRLNSKGNPCCPLYNRQTKWTKEKDLWRRRAIKCKECKQAEVENDKNKS